MLILCSQRHMKHHACNKLSTCRGCAVCTATQHSDLYVCTECLLAPTQSTEREQLRAYISTTSAPVTCMLAIGPGGWREELMLIADLLCAGHDIRNVYAVEPALDIADVSQAYHTACSLLSAQHITMHKPYSAIEEYITACKNNTAQAADLIICIDPQSSTIINRFMYDIRTTCADLTACTTMHSHVYALWSYDDEWFCYHRLHAQRTGISSWTHTHTYGHTTSTDCINSST